MSIADCKKCGSQKGFMINGLSYKKMKNDEIYFYRCLHCNIKKSFTKKDIMKYKLYNDRLVYNLIINKLDDFSSNDFILETDSESSGLGKE